jgi:integrase
VSCFDCTTRDKAALRSVDAISFFDSLNAHEEKNSTTRHIIEEIAISYDNDKSCANVNCRHTGVSTMLLTKVAILSSVPRLSPNTGASKKLDAATPTLAHDRDEATALPPSLSTEKLPRQRLIDSVKRIPISASPNVRSDPSSLGNPSQIIKDFNAETPRTWTRADRPPAPVGIGTTDNEMRDWIRATVQFNEAKAARKTPATIRDYLRKSARLDATRDKSGTIPLYALGSNSHTFYANRAAVIYVATVRAKEALTEIDRADKRYRKAKARGHTDEMKRAQSDKEKGWCDLLVAANDLARHPAGKAGQYVVAQNEFVAANEEFKKAAKVLQDLVFSRPEPPPAGAWKTAIQKQQVKVEKNKGHGKRSVTNRIQRVHPDWREVVFAAVSEKWKLYTAVASITGCRPEEIDGLRFYPDPENTAFLRFEIIGAKTGQGHGIKLRIFSIREDGSAAYAYLTEMSKQGIITVSAPHMKNGKSLKSVVSAFRNAVNEAGRTFLKRKNSPTLSPYCFRHSFACDIKASDYSTKALAIILGHSTTRTQQMYGRSNDGIKGKREIRVDTMAYSIKEASTRSRVDLDVGVPHHMNIATVSLGPDVACS